MPTIPIAIDDRPSARPLKRIGQNADRTRDKLGRFTKQVDKSTTRLRVFGTASVGAGFRVSGLLGTIAGFAAARGAIRAIAGFEETMLSLQGVATDTTATLQEQAATFDSLEDAARDAGASTRFSASEAAEGLLFLSRAGFNANQAIDALPSTLDLAVAGVLELGEAADIASNVVQQFGLASGETARVSNALVRTANQANTDVRQLAEALKLAGPIAKQAGLDVETTAAALGILGDAGVQASLAGTNLRGVLLGLSAPTSKAEKALKELELTASDVNPATNDLTEIFEKLGKGLEDLGKEDKLRVLDAIFGRRNAAAAAILAGATEKLGSEYNKAGLSAKELAEIQDSGLVGSFKALVSATQEAILSLGREGGVGESLKNLTDDLAGAIRLLTGTGNVFGAARVRAERFAAAIKGVGAALAAIAFATVAGNIFRVVTALRAAATAADTFKLALSKTGIGLAAVAVGSLVTALALVPDKADAAAEAAGAYSETMKDLGSTLDRVVRAQNAFAEATGGRDPSLEGQSEAIRNQIAALKELQDDFLADQRKAGNAFDPSTFVDKRAFKGLIDVDLFSQESLADGNLSSPGAVALVQRQIDRLESQLTPIQVELSIERAEASDLADENARRDEATRAAEEAREMRRKGIEEQIALELKAAASIRDLRDGLKDELELLRLDPEVRERVVAVREAEAIAKAAGIKLGQDERSEIIKTVAAIQQEEAAQKAATEARRDAERQAQVESEFLEVNLEARKREVAVLETLIGLTAEERAVKVAAAEIVAAAAQAGLDLTEDQIAAIEELIRKEAELRGEIAKADSALEAQKRRTQELGDVIGNSVGTALEDLANDTADASDVFKAFIRDVIQELFRVAVVKQITTAISSGIGGAGAQGAVLSPAGITRPAAQGMVLGSSTILPAANGSSILAGERPPGEALVPLDRNSKGQLSVNAAGLQPSVTNITLNQRIQSPDADSFRRNKRSQLRQERRDLDRFTNG